MRVSALHSSGGMTWNTCEITRNLSCSAEGPKWCGRKAKTRWIERGSASSNKQSFYPEQSGLLTLPIVGYLCSHRLLTLLLSGFLTRIRPWLKSKSCVHNAQYASGHYRTLGVIRSQSLLVNLLFNFTNSSCDDNDDKKTCFVSLCGGNVVGACDRISSAQLAGKSMAVKVFVHVCSVCFWSKLMWAGMRDLICSAGHREGAISWPLAQWLDYI